MIQTPGYRRATGHPRRAVRLASGLPAPRGIAARAATASTPSATPPTSSAPRQPIIGTRTELPTIPSAAPALKAELNVPTGTLCLAARDDISHDVALGGNVGDSLADG